MRCVEALLICREIHGGLSGVVLEASEVDGVDTMRGTSRLVAAMTMPLRKITVGDLRGAMVVEVSGSGL